MRQGNKLTLEKYGGIEAPTSVWSKPAYKLMKTYFTELHSMFCGDLELESFKVVQLYSRTAYFVTSTLRWCRGLTLRTDNPVYYSRGPLYWI